MVYCCPLCVYFSSKKQLLFISLQPYIAKVNRANSFNLPSQALLHKSVPTPVFPPPVYKKHPCTPAPALGHRAWPWPHWCPGIISFYILIFLWGGILIKSAFPSSILPNCTTAADSVCDLCISVTQLFFVHFFFFFSFRIVHCICSY